MKKKELNLDLFNKISTKLRRMRHEKHYNQNIFIRKTECGWACCIAGWAVLLSGAKSTREDIESVTLPNDKTVYGVADLAERLLGIDYDQGNTLFSGDPAESWPQPFAQRWADAHIHKTERPSKVAADFLDAIVAGTVTLE